METEKIQSFVEVPDSSDFSIYNIPFGVFIPNESSHPRCCTAIGIFN